MLNWTDTSKYDFTDVLLLEEIQLKWMFQHKDKSQLSVLLRHYPVVKDHICKLSKELNQTCNELLSTQNIEELNEEEMKSIENQFIDRLEDWLIYAKEPETYDQLSFNKWDDSELLGLTDFSGKRVLDIGPGTGSQTFRMANYAKAIYAVEPVSNLRRYIQEKAHSLKYNNIHVVDGILTKIPFENDFADILVTGHVFGDEPEAEYVEMHRVVKPGGMIILMPGNNDLDNAIHEFLIKKGFSFERFFEPGPDYGFGWKRKYWKIK